MLVVGLTGGIGSGKSTVASLFAQHGIAITDTDAIAHALTAPGQPALKAIALAFGEECLTSEGALDRAALRHRVFADPAAKKTLESILHPLIRQAVTAELEQPVKAPYRIVVIPLLFETGAYRDIVDRSLLVDCPEAMQIERAMSRGFLTEAEVRAVMSAQLQRKERLARADDVIINDGDLKKLADQIAAIHKKYIRLA
jgi:dephospho-CoA kinase